MGGKTQFRFRYLPKRNEYFLNVITTVDFFSGIYINLKALKFGRADISYYY